MRRLLVSSILLGFGYLLVYAGVSEGGKWALDPLGALKNG